MKRLISDVGETWEPPAKRIKSNESTSVHANDCDETHGCRMIETDENQHTPATFSSSRSFASHSGTTQTTRQRESSKRINPSSFAGDFQRVLDLDQRAFRPEGVVGLEGDGDGDGRKQNANTNPKSRSSSGPDSHSSNDAPLPLYLAPLPRSSRLPVYDILSSTPSSFSPSSSSDPPSISMPMQHL